jgi:hypothetical protein
MNRAVGLAGAGGGTLDVRRVRLWGEGGDCLLRLLSHRRLKPADVGPVILGVLVAIEVKGVVGGRIQRGLDALNFLAKLARHQISLVFER